MNSVLSTIAAIIVVLLIAALVGPTFIDWNSFRNEIEAQGGKLTGRELRIGGDISFVVLPAPHLTLNDVSLANLGGAENSDFARLGQIDAEVALAPLLSGKISVTSVTVSRPQIHFEVLADGTRNWQGLVSGPVQEDGFFGLSSVSLEKASFIDGTITYSDHRSGRSWRIDHLEGAVIATSLMGPMRADLAFDVADAPFALRLAIGNFSGHRAFPITAELQSRAAPAKVLFSGVSTGFSSASRIDGTGSLEIGTTKADGGQKAHAPFRVEAGIVAGGDGANFRNLVVAMAGTTLKGEGKADWSGRPKASLSLAGEALTLDPVVDRLEEFAADGKVPLGSLAGLPLPQWFDADADVRVAGLLVHDVLVKEAALDLSLRGGKLTIGRAAGDIGGGTQFELSGALQQDDSEGRFEGKVGVASRNLAALSAWLSSLHVEPGDRKADGAAPAPQVPQVLAKEPGRPFSIASDVRLTPERLDFRNLRAAYAASPEPAALKGDLSFAEMDGRRHVSGTLAAGKFDLDPLIALWPQDGPKLQDLLDGSDADLTVTAERLTIAGETVAGLDASAAMTASGLEVRRFNAADLAGAKVAFAGTVQGMTAARLAALQGNFHGTIDAQKADGLLRLAGIAAPGMEGPVQLAFDGTAGEAVDSQAKLDTIVVKGAIGSSRVDAVLKRGRTADGNVDRVDLIANGMNGDGRALLRLLGLKPGDGLTGAGTMSLQMNGAADKPYDTALRVNVGEGTLVAKGALTDPLGAPSFAGHVDISASAMTSVLAAAGASPAVSSFAVAQAGGPSFVLSTDVQADGAALALTNLETVAGNFHLSGDATYGAGGEDKLPQLSAKLEVNVIDLTPVFATTGAADRTAWPAAPLDWSVLGTFDGDVALKAGTLKLGTLRLDRNDMRLTLAKGVLSATPFKARFADGNATIGARFEGDASGEPGIGLNIAVEGADIALVGPQVFGASFGTGRIDINAELEGQGRSWLALVSSVSGAGSFRTRSAGLAPMNLPAFSDGLKKLRSLDDFTALQESAFGKGNTPVSGLEGDFTMKDAVVSFRKEGLELKGGTAKLAAMFDLARLAADSELEVTLADPEGAPSFTITAAGKVGAVERRIDTAALQNFVSTRLLKETAEKAGLKFIPKELKKLIGLGAEEAADKAPAAAGVPLPMARPEPKASLN